jgi:hypothetical protein
MHLLTGVVPYLQDINLSEPQTTASQRRLPIDSLKSVPSDMLMMEKALGACRVILLVRSWLVLRPSLQIWTATWKRSADLDVRSFVGKSGCSQSLSFYTDLSFWLFTFSCALIFSPAFTYVPKANETVDMSFVNPVCPSFHTKQLRHHMTKFGEI